MPKRYGWLWFDADGTLFDFNAAEGRALELAFQAVKTAYAAPYLAAYRAINQQLWLALERHEITAAALPVRRFELLLETFALAGSPEALSAAYLEHLALGAELMDGAEAVLRSLQPNFKLAIVTNGLKAVQRSRLEHSPLRGMFVDVIISEEVGAAKPHAAFFEAAMERLGRPARREVLIIGDSLTSDMQGGVNFGLDTCWFNPEGLPRPDGLPLTYEIRHLRELLEIVGQARRA
jgi:2-haloacid dehalogenase